MSESNIPNVWTVQSGHNPYLHNSFALLGLNPEAGLKALAQRCNAIMARLQAGFEIESQGKRLAPTDVARAQSLMAQQEAFAVERLLAHTPVEVDLAPLDAQIAALSQISLQASRPTLPLPLDNLALLEGLWPESPPVQLPALYGPPDQETLDLLAAAGEKDKFWPV